MKETQELIKEIEKVKNENAKFLLKYIQQVGFPSFEMMMEKDMRLNNISELVGRAKERLSNFKQWLKQVEDVLRFLNNLKFEYNHNGESYKFVEEEIKELNTLKEDLIKQIQLLENVK